MKTGVKLSQPRSWEHSLECILPQSLEGAIPETQTPALRDKKGLPLTSLRLWHLVTGPLIPSL